MLHAVALRLTTLGFFLLATYGLARLGGLLLGSGSPLAALSVLVAVTWVAIGWATAEAWLGRRV